MIRLFATDLDDTLLNKEKQIDKHNLLALERLQQAGIQVTVASGRNEVEIENVVKNVPGDFHRVCQNGAFIYLNSKERIYEQYFDRSLAQAIYEVGKKSGLFCFTATAQNMYIAKENDFLRQLKKKVNVQLDLEPNLEQRISTDLLPSKFCFLGLDEELAELAKTLDDTFPDRVDSFISTPNCLDVMPKGVNKGNGIRHLAEQLSIDLTEVACIGDSENDISMFQTIPNSFVMNVAQAHVKHAAKRIVSSVAEAVDFVLEHNQQLAAQR